MSPPPTSTGTVRQHPSTRAQPTPLNSNPPRYDYQLPAAATPTVDADADAADAALESARRLAEQPHSSRIISPLRPHELALHVHLQMRGRQETLGDKPDGDQLELRVCIWGGGWGVGSLSQRARRHCQLLRTSSRAHSTCVRFSAWQLRHSVYGMRAMQAPLLI